MSRIGSSIVYIPATEREAFASLKVAANAEHTLCYYGEDYTTTHSCTPSEVDIAFDTWVIVDGTDPYTIKGGQVMARVLETMNHQGAHTFGSIYEEDSNLSIGKRKVGIYYQKRVLEVKYRGYYNGNYLQLYKVTVNNDLSSYPIKVGSVSVPTYPSDTRQHPHLIRAVGTTFGGYESEQGNTLLGTIKFSTDKEVGDYNIKNELKSSLWQASDEDHNQLQPEVLVITEDGSTPIVYENTEERESDWISQYNDAITRFWQLGWKRISNVTDLLNTYMVTPTFASGATVSEDGYPSGYNYYLNIPIDWQMDRFCLMLDFRNFGSNNIYIRVTINSDVTNGVVTGSILEQILYLPSGCGFEIVDTVGNAIRYVNELAFPLQSEIICSIQNNVVVFGAVEAKQIGV